MSRRRSSYSHATNVATSRTAEHNRRRCAKRTALGTHWIFLSGEHRMPSIHEDYVDSPVRGWTRIQEVLLTDELDDDVRLDVNRVCDEVVARVKENIVILVDRLLDHGYQFWAEEAPITEPPTDIEAKLAELQRIVSTATHEGQPCPALSPLVEAWFRRIGSVDLTGYSDQWGAPVPKKTAEELGEGRFLTDAIQFFSIDEVTGDLRERVADGETCVMGFSGDVLHKMGASGGSRYQMDIWSYDVDPFLLELPKEQRLVPHLRESILKWAGFPGFHAYKNPPRALIKDIVSRLRPF